MKYFASILFACILLGNLFGYQFLATYLQSKADATVEVRVDNKQYDNSDLILVKTALHLPYYTNSKYYERAYGSLNVNGRYYQYVKRRIYNDSLELLCLPNVDRTKLQSVKNDLVKNNVDGQESRKTSNHNNVKINLTEFLEDVPYALSSTSSQFIKSSRNIEDNYLSTGYKNPQKRPPQPLLIES